MRYIYIYKSVFLIFAWFEGKYFHEILRRIFFTLPEKETGEGVGVGHSPRSILPQSTFVWAKEMG